MTDKDSFDSQPLSTVKPKSIASVPPAPAPEPLEEPVKKKRRQAPPDKKMPDIW